MLPIKLKTEEWTVYASEFERVQQLKTLNFKASSKKKRKSKKQAGKQKTGLQDWHIGDAVTSGVAKLEARPSLNMKQAGHIHQLANHARKAAEEQLQKSMTDGFTPEQIRRMIERDNDDDAVAAEGISPMDAIRKSQERLLTLEKEAGKGLSGDALDEPDPELEPEPEQSD